MDFSNLYFWFFLIPSLALICIVSYFLSKKKPSCCIYFEKIALLLLSLTFLGFTNPLTLIIFLGVTLITYWGVKLLQSRSSNTKKIALCVMIPVLLSPLIYYKYAWFIGSHIPGFQWDTLRHLIIPAGISFYTFQNISFCIDTLSRGQKVPRFLDFMNFSGYFPQIVAGPIERRENFLPQIENFRFKWSKRNLDTGIRFIVLGLFFKLCLADNLSLAFCAGKTTNVWLIWMNNLSFTLRIYFDFAGYGIIAYGLARCMGLRLTMNFLSPLTASNVSDYWRRWHISLTSWFRDYIYFNMGGSRTRRWALNIVLVFLISGIWHGAGWNFILWGVLIGITMVLHRIFRKVGGYLPTSIATVLTFCCMVFIWMFFYETDTDLLWEKTKVVFSPSCYTGAYFYDFLRLASVRIMPFVFFVMLGFIVVFLEWLGIQRRNDPYAILTSPIACGIWVFLLMLFNPGINNQFIYFAF